MTDTFKDHQSRSTGAIYVERHPRDGRRHRSRTRDTAKSAQLAWGSLPLAARCEILGEGRRRLRRQGARHRREKSPGRWAVPFAMHPARLRGFEERARYMLDVAPQALAAVQPADKAGFRRQIKRVPLGVVAVVAPWNYPYLTAVNAVLPALIAGNAVVLKASHQTPLCAERFLEAFTSAGVPSGVFQYLHLSHADTARLMGDARVASVCFTGSVSGGRAVIAATGSGFATSGLELGGKDPAYVRADANLANAIDSLTDGAFFNAGQSCCGIKRIYVAAPCYEEFVAGVVELTYKYRLGSPLDPETTLGPVVRTSAAEVIRAQVRDAVARGARQLIDESSFAASAAGTPYLAPQVLVGVDHSMPIMREETFGPAVGIMKVTSDDEAVGLMNDSEFGLTAAIYSADAARAEVLGDALETGTVFLNRCDYLDPALAWTGVKNSGRGCTLSRVGFEQLTRPKSFHFKVTI